MTRTLSPLTRRLNTPAPVDASSVTGPIRLVLARKLTAAPIITGLVGAIPIVLLIIGAPR